MLPRGRETWRRDPRMGMLVIVAGTGLLAFLALAAAVILAPAFIRADVAVSAAIRSIELPGLTEVATAASWVGDFWPMAILTLVAAAAFALQGRRTTALMLIVAVLGAAGLGNLVKLVFMRARPAVHALIEMPESYSFPSGHAITSFAFFATLAFLALLHRNSLRRALVYVAGCAIAAMAIALSRVYLGVHYFADVAGSWLLGSAWLAFIVLLFARWGTGTSDEDSATRTS